MPAATTSKISEIYPLKHGRPSRLQQAVRALVEVALEQPDSAQFLDDAMVEIDTAINRI